MRIIFIRLCVVIVAVILQSSFFNLISFNNLIIDILPLIALVWVIIVGFELIWPWIVILGIFADLSAFERVGVNVIFFIGIAYVISFFSRRFLIEKRSAGFMVITLFLLITSLFLEIGRLLVIVDFSIARAYNSIGDVISLNKLIFQSIFNIILFYIIYFPINKIENNIKNYKIKIKEFS